MKRNILVFLLTIIVSIILIYPLGYLLNKFIFHQQGGGGFDVGPDKIMIDLFIGGIAAPPFLASLAFSIWGRGKWKWVFAIILSLLSIFLFRWAGIYLIIPFISFAFGLILAKFIYLLISKTKYREKLN